MKIALLSLTLISSIPAFASDLVLKDASVIAIETLLNEKHAGKCILPKENDIHWMCTGARMPGPPPALESFGCGLVIEIECPTETATVYGQTKSYRFNDSNGTSTTTPETFSIHAVGFKAK